MPTNDFLPFCATDTGTNLLTESEYTASSDRTSGNKPGVASSKLNNKALRQANAITSQVAQYLANTTGTDILDDAVSAKLLAQMTATLIRIAPNVTRYTSGSGNWNTTYVFFIASGSATVGATYTNNGVTYTVAATIASGTTLRASGNGAPAVSGTLTKASGTGDATITFYAVRSALEVRVQMVGGGGGGSGSGTGAGGAGGTGGNTTFGSNTAAGGVGGVAGGTSGGAGGAATVGTGTTVIATDGSGGVGGNNQVTANQTINGGAGGTSFLGGAGGKSAYNAAGQAATTNSGSGGQGGGSNNVINSNAGAGGGAGAYVEVLIASPAATYAYGVGAAGTAGTAGTSGLAGGAGAAGMIVVTEYYQ